MKTSKSISLDIEMWNRVETFRQNKSLSSISEAIEHLLKKAFEEVEYEKV